MSPLRLDNDAVVYLNMATNLTDGLPVESNGLPVGYPAFISLLEGIGLDKAFFFVLANCAFIALGLTSVAYLFDKREDGRESWVVPLSLLSVPLIRYIAMPLPEVMFFGVSLAAVGLMTAATRSSGRRRLSLLAGALVLTGLAITVRLVGFALVPPLLWACTHRELREMVPHRQWTSREKWMSAAAVIVIASVALLLLGDSFRKYSYEAGLQYLDGRFLSHMTGKTFGFLERVGEVAVNLPATKFGAFRPAFAAAGLAALVWVLATVRLRRPKAPASIYLVTFILLLLLWPYNALRLWLPIVPLVIGYVERATLRFTRGRKWNAFIIVYRGWFVLTGIAALAYTTRITLSGKNFSRVYGVVGGMATPEWQTGRVNEDHNRRARALMKRYGNPFLVSIPGWLPDGRR